MDKANIAERLLRCVADPARASEFVGDQLEARPEAGNLQFWMAIVRVFLAFSRRTILGVAVSPIAGLILAGAFFVFINPQLQSIVGKPETLILEATAKFRVELYVLGVSMLLWAATVFSLMRFGLRSTLAQIGLMASILCSASSSFFDQKIPLIVLAFLWAAYLCYCMSSAHRRRALGIMCSAVSVAWLTAFALSVIPHDPYSVFGKWQFLTAVVLVPIFESGTILSLRRRFLV